MRIHIKQVPHHLLARDPHPARKARQGRIHKNVGDRVKSRRLHFMERVKIYNEEKFEVKMYTVKLK